MKTGHCRLHFAGAMAAISIGVAAAFCATMPMNASAALNDKNGGSSTYVVDATVNHLTNQYIDHLSKSKRGCNDAIITRCNVFSCVHYFASLINVSYDGWRVEDSLEFTVHEEPHSAVRSNNEKILVKHSGDESRLSFITRNRKSKCTDLNKQGKLGLHIFGLSLDGKYVTAGGVKYEWRGCWVRS
jgi:hypothetical protein